MNARLLNRVTVPAAAGQRKRLARWLAAWAMDRALRDDTATARGPGADPPRPGPPVRHGQIRLLHPVTPAACARPLYLAVLDPAGPESRLAVPFGRFTEPAFPGELATRRRAPCLRVLCLWNAAPVPDRVLRQSWMAGRLTAAEQRDALAVLRTAQPSPALCRRMGPPLVHPLDPRHVYRQEDLEVMAELQDAETCDPPAAHALIYEALEEREQLRAAEKRARYRTARRRRKP
jgi:hypothetical protein